MAKVFLDDFLREFMQAFLKQSMQNFVIGYYVEHLEECLVTFREIPEKSSDRIYAGTSVEIHEGIPETIHVRFSKTIHF